MKKVKILVIAAACLAALGLLWNSFGARALLAPDAGVVTPPGKERWSSRSEFEGPTDARSKRVLADLEATNTPVSIQGTNTPAPPVPEPTNTPVAPASRQERTIESAPAGLRGPGGAGGDDLSLSVAEERVQDEEHVAWALERAERLRQAGVRFAVSQSQASSPKSGEDQTPAPLVTDPPARRLEEGEPFSAAEAPSPASDGRSLEEGSASADARESPKALTDQQTFYSVADASLLQGAPTFNDGSDVDMWVGYEHCFEDFIGIVRGLVQFDLSGIPGGASIQEATLRVYLTSKCDIGERTHEVTVYRTSASWSESSVTWNSRPDFADPYGSAWVPSETWGWYSFDVTDLVRGWAEGDFSNYGLMLRGPESSGNDSARLGFSTKEGEYLPQLVVEYTVNAPPDAPSNPSPANGATNQDLDVDLSWTGGDPDPGDTVTYDVYFAANDSTPGNLLCNDVSTPSCNPGTLDADTQYYWYVRATDNHGASTTGATWSFTTGAAPNSPPNTPSNPSPGNGATNQALNVDLSWTGGDPDSGDTVTYDVYFAANDSTPGNLLCNDVSTPSCSPGTLDAATQYYWYVRASDGQASTTGPTWNFVTTSDGAEETCVDVLLNPQMDVVEFGDGTGSIDHWAILFQNIYYSTEDYQSPSHSLLMVDEPAPPPGEDPDDPDLIEIDGETMDYDEFGQGFQAPPNMTYLRISYNRAYANANSADQVWSNLWTLDSEGYLEDLVVYAPIGESSAGWSGEYWDLEAEIPDENELLKQLSGRPLALLFDMLSDRAAPSEVVWLDDAQVRICYRPGSGTVYLPLVVKQPVEQPGPVCSPREPDSIDRRGAVDVGATCGGSFSVTDQRDYYSVNLNGASAVQLRLFNLPSGSNFDALIYEDTTGYPLRCHIGTMGDQDKSANCDLNPSRSYFVLVNRGPQPEGGAYNMSLTRR